MDKFTADNAKKRYEVRIRALLKKWNRLLKGSIDEWSDEEYVWVIFTPNKVDVSLTLTEERVREGEGNGLAFFLDIVEYGGRVLGEFCPYNFSNDLWCHDWANLDERFRMFEKLSSNSIRETVMKKDKR